MICTFIQGFCEICELFGSFICSDLFFVAISKLQELISLYFMKGVYFSNSYQKNFCFEKIFQSDV
jgi:hypothetical protein